MVERRCPKVFPEQELEQFFDYMHRMQQNMKDGFCNIGLKIRNRRKTKRETCKKLMESIREYKTASILTPVYVTVEVIMEVLIPFVMASLIDKGIEAEVCPSSGNMESSF